jgi:hypothetical protein
MNKKYNVFVWNDGIKVNKMDTLKGQEAFTNRKETPAESIANLLGVVPSCDLDHLYNVIIKSVRFSMERGENDRDMMERMNTDIMRLRTEYKDSLGQ